MASNPYTTNLEVQLDARDITGKSDGDSITTWTDSSAAGNDATQATSSRRPIYKTNIIGSNPVVRFDTGKTKSLYGSYASSWSGYTGITWFIVCQYYTYPGHNYPCPFSTAATTNGQSTNGIFIYGGETTYSPAGRLGYTSYVNPTYDKSSFSLVQGSPTIYGLTAKAGTAGIKSITPFGVSAERSVLQLTSTPQEYVVGNAYLSSAVSTLYGFIGDIALMLVYKEYMSDTNSESVMDWILDEFDLHTQAAGGGGLLRSPGMSGGMNA